MASKPVAEVPAVTLVDNGVKVILTSEMTEVAVGDEVAVMIRGDSKGYALTAVDVKLAYDPDKFEFVELKNTDAAGNPGVLPDQLGPGVELKPGLTRLVLGSGIGNEIPAGADLVLGTLVLRVKSVEGDLAVRVLEDSIAAVKELRSNTLDRELGRVEFGKKG